jgi:hypothetical protein
MLGIAGFVAMIVMIYQTFKTARDNSRNGVLWALASFGVGITFQFIVPIVLGVVLALIIVAKGVSDPTELQSQIMGPANIIGIACLALSFVGMWLIYRHVSKVPDFPISAEGPPPPPEFS